MSEAVLCRGRLIVNRASRGEDQFVARLQQKGDQKEEEERSCPRLILYRALAGPFPLWPMPLRHCNTSSSSERFAF